MTWSQRVMLSIMTFESIFMVILVCVVFVWYDRTTILRNYKDNLLTLADIIGKNNAAALEFDEAKTAKEILSIKTPSCDL